MQGFVENKREARELAVDNIMSFMKRDSLSAIIHTITNSTDDVTNAQSQSAGPIGKVISRARVSEMETQLKTMINEKFTNQSSIISKLQDSQNA